MSSPSHQQRQLLYFADPMCSWCWGFSPVIEQIAAQFGKELPLSVIMGGLRAGNSVPMDNGMKRDISAHWNHVNQRTGQEFDYSFFDRDGFVYDTGPVCRAVVAAKIAFPGQELAFLKHLHQAFYQLGVDTTSGPELLRLAIEFGFDEGQFAQMFSSEECTKALANDFHNGPGNGIRAFPALLGGSIESGFMAITHGYKSFEELEPSLKRLLTATDLPNGLMPGLSEDSCEI